MGKKNKSFADRLNDLRKDIFADIETMARHIAISTGFNKIDLTKPELGFMGIALLPNFIDAESEHEFLTISAVNVSIDNDIVTVDAFRMAEIENAFEVSIYEDIYTDDLITLQEYLQQICKNLPDEAEKEKEIKTLDTIIGEVQVRETWDCDYGTMIEVSQDGEVVCEFCGSLGDFPTDEAIIDEIEKLVE